MRPGRESPRLMRRASFLHLLASIGLCLSTALCLPLQAAGQTCATGPVVPFAGHALPLDGSLVEEEFSFSVAHPLWNGAGLGQVIFVAAPPDGSNRLFLVEQGGVVRSIDNQPDVTAGDLRTVLDLGSRLDDNGSEEGLLGLAFDPDFANNGYFYVHYTADPLFCDDFSRCQLIERYRIDPAAPDTAVPGSDFVVMEIDRPGSFQNHNGGMIAFGPDGLLYVSVGDQNLGNLAADTTDLRGSLLRIGVDSGVERAPTIPAGNPFGNAILHYGLRNPWRFSFDRGAPGDLWIADVGAATREEVTWLPAGTLPGRDLGWPDCEGTVSRQGAGCTPTQTPPDLEYGRSEGIAVIGGYVYRGALASLQGHYVWADFSGRVFTWDRTTRDGVTGLGLYDQPFALGTVASFGEDEAGELYLWEYGNPVLGTIAGSGATPGAFPTTLAGTGLFSDVASLTPAPGLIEYEVASPLWSDGAAKRRWIALPSSGGVVEPIRFATEGGWTFPVGTALVKHFELEQSGAPPRRLETRVFLHQNGGWIGFTYRWNAGGTQADLLLDGLVEDVTTTDGTTTWGYPSPTGCLECHSGAAGRVLGVRTLQLNGPFGDGSLVPSQLDEWACLGLFETTLPPGSSFARHVAVDDGSASLQARARSYLDVNCAVCHQPGGLGSTDLDLRGHLLLGEMNVLDVAPTRGDLGLSSPRLIDPGDHDNSIVSVRAESTDVNLRMARGTRAPDPAATSVFADWIDTVLFDAGLGRATLDSDGDGVEDEFDNCPAIANPGQENADADATGDVCDPDQLPALSIAGVNIPTFVEMGSVQSIAALVANDGPLPASPSLVRIHLSDDDVLDASDPIYGACVVMDTAGLGFSACTDAAVVIPADVDGAPGIYHWITCADALDQVLEDDETDNCVTNVVSVPEPDTRPALVAALVLTAAMAAHRRRRPRMVTPRPLA